MIYNSCNAIATNSADFASVQQNTKGTVVDTPFGQMFVQNLDSDTAAPGSDSGAQPKSDALAAASTSKLTVQAAATTTTTTTTTDANAPLVPGVASNDPNSTPSAELVFGDTPWMQDAGGSGPTGNFNLNPMYFASQQTADMVAKMVGGSVVQVDTFAQTPGNHFKQNQPNEMIKLTDGTMINPGLVAGFFTHGYQLSMVKQMIQNEVTNVEKEKGVATA